MILPETGHCFHCGEPVPAHANNLKVELFGEARAMCCMGCMLAAESIRDLGLSSYYLDRSEINRKAALPTELTELRGYDHKDVKQQFVYQESADTDCSVADLSVVGLRCAACSWLIEKRLLELPAVQRATVNLTTQRMQVVWRDDDVNDDYNNNITTQTSFHLPIQAQNQPKTQNSFQHAQNSKGSPDANVPTLKISDILYEIDKLGYEARPYRKDTHNERLRSELKSMLLRLVVSGLGAMQAMMFAVALYFGFYQGMSADDSAFLRWVSLIVSIPVFFYAGWPFYSNALSSLKARQVNMDVPVSLALIITFFASAYAVIASTGETYFDSVSMFIFFLLAGRYIEHRARLQAASIAGDLLIITPDLVSKRLSTGETERISAHNLKLDDEVLVGEGETVAADGIVLDSAATVSLALITGESAAVKVQQGGRLVSGAQNYGAPFVMRVTALPKDSTLNVMDKLVARALSEKPKLAEQADRWASWFVARVLVLAAVVFAGWYLVAPDKAVWATVAVLVATCPCALSLATPIALTMATNRLARSGFLITRPHVLETLGQIDHVIFDKTGTLTQGRLWLRHAQLYDQHAHSTHPKDNPKQYARLLGIAASLEQGSSHPIAKAFKAAAQDAGVQLYAINDTNGRTDSAASKAGASAHGGVCGYIDGVVYKLGHAEFVGLNPAMFKQNSDLENDVISHQMQVYLVACMVDELDADAIGSYDTGTAKNSCQLLATFTFADVLRQDSQAAIAQLKQAGLHTTMLTGDPNAEALSVAHMLGLDDAKYNQSPTQKLAHLEQLQAKNSTVMMVGDGINDAPVLAKANLSVAMASAADLAQVSADSVVLQDDLMAIDKAFFVAKKTQTIIKQNLTWAIGYNALVLIPAALGFVPPWLAALGMSFSSLVVVLNALRLK